MSFDARCFWHAKDLASVADYEDAFDVDPNTGRAAIADGVSTAIFSRRWAQLLTGSSVANPPAWEDDASVNAWILEQRKAWAKSINIQTLPWMQKAKLEQSGGAYAAFLWAEVLPARGSGPDGAEGGGAEGGGIHSGFRCRSVAVGDCCLFHVRGGEMLGRFPLSCEADFARDPLTFCSSSRNRQPHPPLHRCEFECHAGDWIVLSSDALAKWLYRLSDAGQPIDWHSLWRQDAYEWTQRVGNLRLLNASERIRVDDTTLLILRVGQTPSASVVEASESAVPTVIVDDLLALQPSVDSGSSEPPAEIAVAANEADENMPTAGEPQTVAQAADATRTRAPRTRAAGTRATGRSDTSRIDPPSYDPPSFDPLTCDTVTCDTRTSDTRTSDTGSSDTGSSDTGSSDILGGEAITQAVDVTAQQDADPEAAAMGVPDPVAAASGTGISTSDPSTPEAAPGSSGETAGKDEPPAASAPDLR